MASNLLTRSGTKIRKYTGFTSAVGDSFTVASFNGNAGVAWDGANVLWHGYYSTPGTEELFKKGTGFSNTVQSSFAIATSAITGWNGLDDIDYDGANILFSSSNVNIYRTVGFSSTIDSYVTFSRTARSVTWDGTNLLVGAINAALNHWTIMWKCSGFSSTITASLDFGTSDCSNSGLAWDGTNLIANQNSSKYIKLAGFSTTISDSFTGSSGCAGMDWDGFPYTFAGERANIIAGLTSAQSETLGWNNEVRDKIPVTDVVRTSDTAVTITLSAESGYNITANETITATIPATAVTGAGAIVASPTFTVAYDHPVKGVAGIDWS